MRTEADKRLDRPASGVPTIDEALRGWLSSDRQSLHVLGNDKAEHRRHNWMFDNLLT